MIVKNSFKQLLKIPVPWVYILAYLMGLAIHNLWPILLLTSNVYTVSKITGAILMLSGLLIAAWSQVIFRKLKTTTIPGKVSKELITWGPYSKSRNPMYISLSLIYLGEAALLLHVWPIVFLPFVLSYINAIVIPLEESKLQEAFGDKYIDYCQRVRRWV